MPLDFGRSDFRFDGDYIHFRISIAEIPIRCAVTAQYLAAYAARHGLPQGRCRATFVIARPEIENIALKLFRSGSERPLITNSDLPD
jgi:hypothetical protein